MRCVTSKTGHKNNECLTSSDHKAIIGRDEDKDKESSFQDKNKDKDLKIGPWGSSRTSTFLEDNNTENN